MSTDKEEIALYYEAKNDKVRKRLGIKGGFYWRTAKKLSVAISRGVVAMDDAGFDEEDFKKPVRVNLPIVNDLPPEGVFDTEFCNRYEKGGEDGITMIFIAPSPSVQDKPASSDNTNVNGEDMAEIEDNMLLPISGQELPIRWLAQHGSEKPVTHVSREELQALHIARAEELPAVTALAISHNTKLLDPLEIRDLHKLVRDTDKVFPNPVNSSLGLMTAFFEAYLDADYTDRGLLTKEWMKGNRVLRISRTPSGANAGGGILTDRGEGFVHDDASVERDVAAGVLARSMDIDIYNPHPAHAKRIEEIVSENKPPFSVFRDKFIAMPGHLDYSRAIVVASVKEAPIGIEATPHRVTEYLNKVLTETDHATPDPEIVDIACGRSSAPMPQRVTKEGKQDDEEKPQPTGAMADEQATTEAVEPDTTEHNQDTQSMDAQPQINSVDAKYQKLRAELHEARKNIPPKNPVDADKLLAASHGEFVEGISDPNDPKWVKGIETRDSVNQNQHESEQNDQKAEQNSPNALQNEPETKLPEPEVQQEPEKVCTACGQTGDGNCPDCGAVMGDATYQETFDEKNQAEVQEDDSEEMESAVYPNKECTEGDQHANGNNETGETANPLIKVNGHHESTSTSRLWHHLMIDLETMGKNPDAPINALAGKFFDPATGEMGPEFSKTIDLETAGGVIDRDTIKWWLKQSREAQSAILTDEIPLDDALLQLREFIDENSGEFFVQVWGNGANFDNVILRRSYERQGIPCPWRYTNDRDVRTMVALGLVMDFDARSVITFEGERHNALHDARYQAKYVSAIWQKLIPSQADF
ncbi:3'-5' exoribonuclease [Escherichia coli]|uniref:exonuclease n=3 Tax=Escherichia coli TaxID=562 RepID=UPI00044DF4D3|nr:exonuclease [Escherichia coli]EIL1079742.1 3'-5' exoribonuclease [Escherichia coli O157]EKF4487948.1 3'-5' exoribonuclease [Escherichia coli O113]EKH5294453.1 3'-5' exoribonuclease [Escherichia coli O26]EKK2291417.1 3'-5' exoribonuclease [Escherichia coli O8]EKK2595527.1 3'-5' exoribonuclease [Escherichia coli O110]EKK2900295.1 3'-5' exoribonuclease [Escherichia coli O96]EKK3634763.1 3'-5' exoribonuclease [Escherichia coli O20]ELP2916783.1 3'-5' exoribonuclease [Escherichia coli O168]EL